MVFQDGMIVLNGTSLCPSDCCQMLRVSDHVALALQEFTQTFERGVPSGPMQQRKPASGSRKKSGTTVRFLYDKGIFTPG